MPSRKLKVRPPPLANSYWLPGGQVLAGEYPGFSVVALKRNLMRLLDAGIRSFVDLTQARDGLIQYEGVLQQLGLAGGQDIRYRRIGIRDMDVPTPALMAEILSYIDSETEAGRKVYLHCWGGIGRTGTVVGCVLARRESDAETALAMVGTLFRTMSAIKLASHPEGSPQTERQHDFVRNWPRASASLATDSSAADPAPLDRREFDAGKLVSEHPPVLSNANKRVVFAASCPPGSIHAGTLHYSRWSVMPVPEKLDLGWLSDRTDIRPTFFEYPQVPGDSPPWHVNFADPDLFGFYGGPLFAQDEMQVAEHPALASLREALGADEPALRTVEHGEPTPILIAGVERRCSVATERDPDQGRPEGLYGSAFARASSEAVRRATIPLDRPTTSNIIAMAAPRPSHGQYTMEQVSYILRTAYTGFRTASLESARLFKRDDIVIHTGFWGCGAFGGNRVVMTALQAAAASLVGVDELILYTGSGEGWSYVQEAGELLLLARSHTTTEFLHELVARRFEWGTSDGN